MHLICYIIFVLYHLVRVYISTYIPPYYKLVLSFVNFHLKPLHPAVVHFTGSHIIKLQQLSCNFLFSF